MLSCGDDVHDIHKLTTAMVACIGPKKILSQQTFAYGYSTGIISLCVDQGS